MPVVSVTCNYKKPAVMGDILTIITSIDKEPKAKVEVNTMIYNQNMDLVCTGSVILGVLHGTSRKPTRVPQYLLDAFNSYNNTI
jgi:acyl-CoA thioester hydrolase